MICSKAYKLYIDNKSASSEIIENIEEIVINQEIDLAWEARIKVRNCVNEKGEWTTQSNEILKSGVRIRVELQIENSPYIPLIDGPVIGYDMDISFEPGQSNITAFVLDDSVYLNESEEIIKYESKSDIQIVQEIFKKFSKQIPITCIETNGLTDSVQDNSNLTTMQRESPIRLLRRLAKRQGMHVYVLPGSDPGESIGNFRTLPDGKTNFSLPCPSFTLSNSSYAPMVLLGEDRNVKDVRVRNNGLTPKKVLSVTFQLNKKTKTSSESEPKKVADSDSVKGFDRKSPIGFRYASPYTDGPNYLKPETQGEVERSAYAIETSGMVLKEKYSDVLIPYQLITVKGTNPELTGEHIIWSVTHTINKSFHEQSFVLRNIAKT